MEIIMLILLVITEYKNSWNVLMDLNIINYNDIFIFGSKFKRDRSNIYLYINHIKNLQEIHQSLYHMLNQRYIFVKNSGKMYCRIVLGSNSQTCFIDSSFKLIVITSKKHAYDLHNGTPKSN